MTGYDGTCTITRVGDRLFVDRADEHVLISPELLDQIREGSHPDATYIDGVLRIDGANRTVAYRVGRLDADGAGTPRYLADRMDP